MALEKNLLTACFRKGEIHVIRKSTRDICRFPQVSWRRRDSWWKNVTYDQGGCGHGFWLLPLNGTPPWRGQGKRNFRWWNWSSAVDRNDRFRRQSDDASRWCNWIGSSVRNAFQEQIEPRLWRARHRTVETEAFSQPIAAVGRGIQLLSFYSGEFGRWAQKRITDETKDQHNHTWRSRPRRINSFLRAWAWLPPYVFWRKCGIFWAFRIMAISLSVERTCRRCRGISYRGRISWSYIGP